MDKKGLKKELCWISITQILILILSTLSFSIMLSDFTIAQETNSPVPIDVNKLGTRTFKFGGGEYPLSEAITAPDTITGLIENGELTAAGTKALQDAGLKNPLLKDNQIMAGGSAAPGLFTEQGLGGQLYQGAYWSVLVVGAVLMVGQLAGWEQEQTKSVAIAAAAGIMAGHLTSGILAQTQTWQTVIEGLGVSTGTIVSAGVGLVVGVAVLLATYQKEKEKTVSFICEPWQPPVRGEKCEECNKNPLHKCTEYKCRSLGQACQLLNKENPGKEMCTWVNPKDVNSPVISPYTDVLSPTELSYISDTSIRPPALGVKIVRGAAGDGCLKAFTPLVFGISTNEPARCKIDFNHTIKFGDMRFDFGESSDFAYNHTQRMRLPGPAYNQTGTGSPILQNDGTMQLFVRCMDANENQNADEYSVKFCVDKTPDTTAPNIEGTSIPSGNPVRYNADKVSVAFFVNEPAECRWGITGGQTFENLPNAMECATEPDDINVFLSYTCVANFTGIKNNAENKFYVRCKDKPGLPENERNVMTQDYLGGYVLKGSQPLNIVKVGPNETVSGSTEDVSVDLTVQTDDGAEEGKATCLLSPLGTNDTYVLMAETDNYLHKQTLQLRTGTYTYYFRCTDLGGNSDEDKVTFNVFSDRAAPQVTRVYKEEGAGLKVVTNEDAECRYSLTSCNFVFGEGIALVYSNPSIKTNSYLEWKPNTVYYIKCRDPFGNEPNPNECSTIVKAIETLGAK